MLSPVVTAFISCARAVTKRAPKRVRLEVIFLRDVRSGSIVLKNSTVVAHGIR